MASSEQDAFPEFLVAQLRYSRSLLPFARLSVRSKENFDYFTERLDCHCFSSGYTKTSQQLLWMVDVLSKL